MESSQVKTPLFTDDFKAAPYWWDNVPRPELAARKSVV